MELKVKKSRNRNYLPIERIFVAICANSGMTYKEFCDFFEKNQLIENKITIPEASFNYLKYQYKDFYFPELNKEICNGILEYAKKPKSLNAMSIKNK